MATKVKRYFVVNPAGAIHEVVKEHAQGLLKKPGYRSAKAAEVRKLKAQKGNQRFNQPICEPFKAEPTAVEVEIEESDTETATE